MNQITYKQASDAVGAFEGMSFFNQVGVIAREKIAEKLMRLVNVDLAAFVKADTIKWGLSHSELMRPWSSFESYLNSRQWEIAKDLLSLGVSSGELREYMWVPKTIENVKIRITTADQRLANFVDKFIEIKGGWPSMGEMVLIYMGMYRSGDGYQTDETSSIPGYTWQDHQNGTNIPLLPPEPEPDYKQLAAGEQMTSEEHKQLVDQFAGVLEKMRVKQDANA